MANEFTKTIERQITLKAADPAMPDKTFIVEMSEKGIRLRRLGKREDEARHVSWKSIIGMTLIHLGDE